MAAFLRLMPDSVAPAPGRRVIAAEDYARSVTGAEVLADAEARAEAILAKAEVEAEAERRRGYEEGLAEGQAEIAERMMVLIGRSVDYLATAEQDLARLVILCLRRMLGERAEEDVVIAVARVALAHVRGESRVTLVVRPDVTDAVRARVSEVLSGSGDIGFLEVAADPGMAEGGCRLETELGVVDASIETQLAALERAMTARIGGGNQR